jgi:predicted TIM-barrel fold metal-dependent hydrolase
VTSADLVWSPVLRKFPRLRIALSEGGIGWIPYFLDKIDNVYRKQHEWTGQDYGDRRPSEVFLEQIVVCFIDDRAGMRLLDDLNVDNVTWECDYPHSDSEWPRAPESVMAIATSVDDDTIDRITHRNAMAHFEYDPFAHFSRDECTVGALRARASHVDVSERSMTRRERSGDRSSTAMTDLFEDGAKAG